MAITIDTAAAERDALAAEIARLAGQIETYGNARSVVEARIAALQSNELLPIVLAQEDFSRQHASTVQRLSELNFFAMAGTMEEARRIFDAEEHSLRAALAHVKNSPVSPEVKQAAEREVDALLWAITTDRLPGDNGQLSGGQVDAFWRRKWAVFYPKLRETRERVNAMASGRPPSGTSGMLGQNASGMMAAPRMPSGQSGQYDA